MEKIDEHKQTEENFSKIINNFDTFRFKSKRMDNQEILNELNKMFIKRYNLIDFYEKAANFDKWIKGLYNGA